MNNTILKEMSLIGDYATLSHGRVRYQVAGPANGDPVLLVHGLIGHFHIWDRNFNVLVEQGFRVLRTDLYGRGFSDRVKHPHNTSLFVSQLDELLQHVGMNGPVNLIGLSMGGAVITRFATTFPDRVKSMLWVDSYGIPTPENPLMRITRPRILGELLIGSIGGPVLRQAPNRGVYEREKHVDFNRWFSAPLVVKGSKRALLSTLRNFMLEDHTPHFQLVNEMNIPKQMVWGRHDRVLPLEYGKRLHGFIPSAGFQEFDQSGHLPHFEEPEIFNILMINHLHS
ncbi:MAG: alpha/beta hydrolase [Flavobacteriales bacterium]|nr:alpha/beta hydrolase [Flavobacteriales bacterium]